MSAKFVRLVFEGDFDAVAEADAQMRGYRSHVLVELSDGSRHPITFFEVVRLMQELADECAGGRNFFTEPNLVILPSVSLANMEAAARTLAEEGFFAGDKV